LGYALYIRCALSIEKYGNLIFEDYSKIRAENLSFIKIYEE